MSDFSSTLTLGGFIATIVALLLAILAYVISRRSQLAQRKQSPEPQAPDLTATPNSAPTEPSHQPFDAETNPYRWD